MAGGAYKNPSLSLKYILGHQVSVAIPGMDSIAQVEENQAPATAIRNRDLFLGFE
jgi:aryl-alcohol dehydrogenase-like predicted oxidoreductase